jgi:hypothetical protein
MFLCPEPCLGQVVAGGDAPAGGGQCLRCGKVYESGAAVTRAGGLATFICGGRGRARRCSVPDCKQPQAALCDAPVERAGRRATCDASMCAGHRTRVGPNRDRCPAHAPASTK